MFNNKERDKMIEPQCMLVEERGLENQIKRLKVLIPVASTGFLREQIESIAQSLEDIKTGIKHENDRIMTDQLINNNKQLSFNFK